MHAITELNSIAPVLNPGVTIPSEEISGSITLKLTDSWSTRYRAYHDIDADVTRIQELGLIYRDCCTSIEFLYNERNFEDDLVRNSSGFGIRVSLMTLGDFEPE